MWKCQGAPFYTRGQYCNLQHKNRGDEVDAGRSVPAISMSSWTASAKFARVTGLRRLRHLR
jgi:hypothetical protein